MPRKYRTRECRTCGAAFETTATYHVYCSAACRQQNYVCQQCGKTFTLSKKRKRLRWYCSLGCCYEHRTPVGTVRPDTGGYTIVKVPPGTPGMRCPGRGRKNWMRTHRYVMQQILGRPLQKGETVHHKNGVRDDNRPENLELWKRKQPYGIRSADYHCPGCQCRKLKRRKTMTDKLRQDSLFPLN